MAKLPIDFASVPSGTDVQGMRRWIKEVYLDPVLIEARNKCNFNRRRPQQKVNKTVVSVKSSDGSGETFELWIYQTDDKPPARGKPALMMLHGGGWIHGTPLCDEGKLRTRNGLKTFLMQLLKQSCSLRRDIGIGAGHRDRRSRLSTCSRIPLSDTA